MYCSEAASNVMLFLEKMVIKAVSLNYKIYKKNPTHVWE